MMTLPALNALLFHFMENTAMAVMARLTGISAPTVYRLFYDNIEVPHRTYHLPSVLSIDEFRTTSDEGTFVFHITNPITGKTLDIVSDRTMSALLDYFSRFSQELQEELVPGHTEIFDVHCILQKKWNHIQDIIQQRLLRITEQQG
jgi:transposase